MLSNWSCTLNFRIFEKRKIEILNFDNLDHSRWLSYCCCFAGTSSTWRRTEDQISCLWQHPRLVRWQTSTGFGSGEKTIFVSFFSSGKTFFSLWYFLQKMVWFLYTVKPELTTTSELRPPVSNDHHFEVLFYTFIT